MIKKLSSEICRNVVLVDDDLGVLKALSLLLKVFGFEVTSFDKPQEALAYVISPQNTVHLVISDLRMPLLDGIELLKQIRAHTALPFILISGHATTDDVAKALSEGAQGFIGKPFNPAEFERVFSQINFLDSRKN